MKANNLLLCALLSSVFISCHPHHNENRESLIDQKVDSLLKIMTLEEKLGQMNQISPYNDQELEDRVRKGEIGSILNYTNPEKINKIQKIALEESRLGIPVLVARDVIHGYKTIFPIPLGQAATFNPELVEAGARIAAIEASADGIRWTFSPMIDVSRDPRWGRIAESSGEDTYLNTVMGVAMIKGYQGDSLNTPTSIAACAKHFIGYGAAEGGKDYNSTNIPERQLRNVYFPPFKAAAEVGCATFMTSFNDNNGVPSTANKFILKDVLRNEWHYDGMVVTDWASAAEMINHGFCTNEKEAAEKALLAGIDMEMVSETFIKNLPSSLQEKQISIQEIDRAVRNILKLKYRLGLFENPYIVTPQSVKYAQEHLDMARRAVEQSVILLKNSKETLPIPQSVQTIAIVGPMANAPHDQMGTWVFDGEKEHTITPLKAIQNLYSNQVKIIYEPGLTYSRDKNQSGIAKAVTAASRADMILAFVGEESILSGEAHSLANLNLQGSQKQLIRELAATGKPLVTIVMAGRPLTISDEVEESDALLYSFHPGTMGGPALADILFGKVNPSAKTPVTFPRMTGQVPVFYAQNNTGRPANPQEMLLEDIPAEAEQTSVGCRSFYLDAGTTPLFPFGYGLSYTTFHYSNLQLKSSQLSLSDTLHVSVTLTNTGKYDGTEVVQLYVCDKVGSVTRPVKELKSFKRVSLAKGESKNVKFDLPISNLSFWGYDMKEQVEAGAFKLWVGTNSAEGLSAEFTVSEQQNIK